MSEYLHSHSDLSSGRGLGSDATAAPANFYQLRDLLHIQLLVNSKVKGVVRTTLLAQF